MHLVGVGVVLAALSFVNSQPHADERKKQVYREMFDDSSAKKHWKNPYDMFGNEQDPPPSEETKTVVDDVPPINKDDEQLNVENQTAKNDEPPTMGKESEVKTCLSRDIVFLTRWLKIIYGKLSRKSFFDIGDSKIISFKVTKTRVVRMKKILDAESVNFKDMEDLITDSLSDLWVMDEVSWFSKFYDVVFVLSSVAVIPVLVLVLFVYLMSQASLIKKISGLFLCACIWNWMRLYKEEVAKQHARLERTDVFASCYQKDHYMWFSMKAYFKSWFYDSGDCNEYFKSLMVDPVFNVDPSKAIVDTMCNIVFIPLERLGYYINRFVKNLTFELSLTNQVVAVVIFVVIMVLIFNYRIRLPWFLAVLEPSRNRRNITGPNFPSISGARHVQSIMRYDSDSNEASMQENPPSIQYASNSNEAAMQENQRKVCKSQHNCCDLPRLKNQSDFQSNQFIPEKSMKILENCSNVLPTVSSKPEEEIVTPKSSSSESENKNLSFTSNSEKLSSTAKHRKTVLLKSSPTQNDNKCFLSKPSIDRESNHGNENTNSQIINGAADDISVLKDKQLSDLLKISEE